MHISSLFPVSYTSSPFLWRSVSFQGFIGRSKISHLRSHIISHSYPTRVYCTVDHSAAFPWGLPHLQCPEEMGRGSWDLAYSPLSCPRPGCSPACLEAFGEAPLNSDIQNWPTALSTETLPSLWDFSYLCALDTAEQTKSSGLGSPSSPHKSLWEEAGGRFCLTLTWQSWFPIALF